MAISAAGFSAQLLGFIGADSGITNIVGTRYYYGRLPQLDTFPALTFKIVNVQDTKTHDGVSTYDVIRVQFDCYDEPETAAGATNQVEALYDAVRTAFDRFTDNGGAVEFHQTFFQNRTAMDQDFDTKIYTVSIDFDFHVK